MAGQLFHHWGGQEIYNPFAIVFWINTRSLFGEGIAIEDLFFLWLWYNQVITFHLRTLFWRREAVYEPTRTYPWGTAALE